MTFKGGDPTAFEALVDDYDAARPTYPQALYEALPPLGRCLELGAGTGLATIGLRPEHLVVSDLGPAMLARGLAKHDWPGVVCRAEVLPFADATFDTVFGAQMWHWVGKPAGPLEVSRVLKPGGHLLYARWLRSKSYVQRLPDVEGFVRDSLSDLRVVFGDGPVIEPFVTRLWRFTA